MDTTHNDAPPARSLEPEPKAESESESDRFSCLCGLTSFVTNSKRVLKIAWDLTPGEVSVLCALLLTSEVSISQLALRKELPPGTAAQLGSAVKCHGTIHTMSLGSCYESGDSYAPELFRTLLAAASPALGQLSISRFSIPCEWLIACDSFSQFTALRSLTIATPQGCPVTLLIASIGKLRALESLRISGVDIGDSDAGTLTATLGDNLPQLVELSICCGGFGEKAGRPIGSLVALGRLQKLILNGNKLKDEGVSAIVDTILDLSKSRRCELQQLSLRANNIGPAGEIKLAELIAHSPRLRVLDLSYNYLGRTAADALLRSIQLRAQSLEELDINHCNLDPHGALPLLNGLRAFHALRVLKAGWCGEGDLGAHALSQLLLLSEGCRRRLTELQIQCGGFMASGARELARAFVKAYALRSINMNDSPLEPRGAAAILDALATASTMPMDAIEFGNCRIGDDGASAVGRLILHRGCRSVSLYNDEMHARGAKAIMDSAAASTTCVMKFLDLSYNPIGEEGVKYVLDKMMQSRRKLVHELNIARIKLGVGAATAVKLAVEEHDAIYWIRVDKYDVDAEADEILEGVKKWEHDSKPSRAAILQFS